MSDCNEVRFERRLRSDCGGCYYTLHRPGAPVRMWFVTYGYDNPEWQEQERRDIEKMTGELSELGFDFSVLRIASGGMKT